MDDAGIMRNYGNCVWLLEIDDEMHLVYATQDALIADCKEVEWSLVDSDAMHGTSIYGSYYYATPWPVHGRPRGGVDYEVSGRIDSGFMVPQSIPDLDQALEFAEKHDLNLMRKEVTLIRKAERCQWRDALPMEDLI